MLGFEYCLIYLILVLIALRLMLITMSTSDFFYPTAKDIAIREYKAEHWTCVMVFSLLPPLAFFAWAVYIVIPKFKK